MPAVFEELHSRILDLITSNRPLDEDEFNHLALEIFHFQLESNEIYRRYALSLARDKPRNFKEIPALPASAFKYAAVTSYPHDESLTYFQTSGTTASQSGKHFFKSLDIYEAAILGPFKQFVIPAMNSPRMMFLTPPPIQAPHSSLVHMMNTVGSHFAAGQINYYINRDALQFEEFFTDLISACSAGVPLLVAGTAFAFLYVMEEMNRRSLSFSLPTGSSLMETGGFKGRTREIQRSEFYPMLSKAFGIPGHQIVNEYGMTELSSQFYDNSIAKGSATDLKRGPAWARAIPVDPLTDKEVAPGEKGLLKIFDLANLGSVIALQTEDVGTACEDGFRVLGRVGRAEMRGCSLSVEAT
jgi:hypothetical protein